MYLFRAEGIGKRFGAHRVLSAAAFWGEAGKIITLMGRMRVVFPDPLRPMRVTILPASPQKAAAESTRCAPNRFPIPSARKRYISGRGV